MPNDKIFETEIIPENIKSGRKLFYPYDEEFTGFLDFNGIMVYQTLYEMYPESKFIYTWRAYDPWLKSTLRLQQNIWREGKPVYIRSGPDQIQMVNSNIGQDMPEKEFSILKTDKQIYWDDHQTISEFFKNDPRFLEMRMCDGGGDGWEKLCGFLGKDIPDVAFPHLVSNNHVFANPVDN
jgi:hypothetical protein